MNIEVRQALWPEEKTLLRTVRDSVFIQEQQVPIEIEWDDLDNSAVHFLALHQQIPIGTARLLVTGQFGRMAVMREWRKRGVGAKLLNAIKAHAEQLGLNLYCHAQVSAIPFYARAGFQIEGDKFLEAGIEHQTMFLKQL